MVDGSKNSTSALITGNIILANGEPNFELTSLQFGQQVIPEFLLTQAAGWLNQLLAEKINEQAPGLKIMNINISSGMITISGMR